MNSSVSRKRVAIIVLCLGLLIMALGAMTAAAAPTPIDITGIVGVNTDPGATSGTWNLRYTGNPAPAGYSHTYQWSWPKITCTPDTTPTTFEGTLNVANMSNGDVAFIGLLDNGLLSTGVSGYQSGAYLYVMKNSATNLVVGPTDGNLGGEIVQNAQNVTIPGDNIVDVKLTIDGALDPNTCASGSVGNGVGCLSVEVEGSAAIKDSYGNIKALNNTAAYAHTEFVNGAHPGWDDYGTADIAYDLEVQGCEVVWPEAEIVPADDLICNTTDVTINFSEMPPIYGYQFEVLYDEAKVDATGAFINTWFDTTNWAQIPGGWAASCGSGVCKFGVSKVDPSVPVSGQGPVGKITFTAQTAGVFNLEMVDLVVTNIDGFQIPVQVPPAAIQMTTCGRANLNGKVNLQGRLTPMDAGQVKAIDLSGNFPDVIVPFNSNGNYSLTNLPVMPGGTTYKLQATHFLYVGNHKDFLLLPGNNLTNQNTRLFGGDADNSGLNPPFAVGVDVSDLSCVAGAFDGPPATCGTPAIPNSSTDINKDNITNIQDLAITGGNYTKNPFQNW